MNLIDPRTVIAMAGFMSVSMALVLFWLKRSYPVSIKGLGEWATALMVIFVGGVLVSGRGTLPDFLAISVSYFLLWSGLYLLYFGTQRFFDIRPRAWPWMTLFAVGLLVSGWFTYVEPSYAFRLGISNLVIAYLFGTHGWLIFRQGTASLAKMLAVAVMVLTAAIQLVRFVSLFFLSVGPDIFDTAPHHVFFIASFAVSILLVSINLILMTAERLRTELEHMATHDSLTNALTRRRLNEVCANELERCRRHDRSLALLMMDLDHFKSVNDTFGHQAGDQVLINAVRKIRASLRRPDYIGRYGGEEFVVLLPETSLEGAALVAERIREVCALPSQGPSCTVSIGITTNKPRADTVDSLLARADAAMYRAKANGRNRIETG